MDENKLFVRFDVAKREMHQIMLNILEKKRVCKDGSRWEF